MVTISMHNDQNQDYLSTLDIMTTATVFINNSKADDIDNNSAGLHSRDCRIVIH